VASPSSRVIRMSINAQNGLLRQKNTSKTSKFVGLIAVSNEYTSKMLGQDVSIRLYVLFLDSNGNTGCNGTNRHHSGILYEEINYVLKLRIS